MNLTSDMLTALLDLRLIGLFFARVPRLIFVVEWQVESGVVCCDQSFGWTGSDASLAFLVELKCMVTGECSIDSSFS